MGFPSGFLGRRVFLAGAVFFSSPLFLAGCEMHAPTTLNTEKMQVRQEPYFLDVPAHQADEGVAESVAHHYTRHADGPLRLSVTYDPKNYRNTAMAATQKAADLARVLRKNGVGMVETDILPVSGQGDESQVLISYDSYTAHAPSGCTTMPGTENTLIEPEEGYKLGCTIQTMMAKQIARPKDLEGQGAPGLNTDGRSATNIVDIVRSGEENRELGGESASGQK